MGDGQIESYPAGGAQEAAATSGSAALNMIPLAGGTAAALFEKTLLAPLRRRQIAWYDDVAEKMNIVLARTDGVDFDELVERRQFQSLFATATQAAIKTAFEEKLDALANALANSFAADAPDAHDQFMFLQFIDDLQPSHLQLLGYAIDPYSWYEHQHLEREHYLSAARSAPLEKAFPQWSRDFWNRLAQDLDRRGLIDAGMAGGMVSENAVFSTFATALGASFVAFISPPVAS